MPTLGTNGDDTLTAATGRDSVYGSGGADVISGFGESDTLFGGEGNDTIWASSNASGVLSGQSQVSVIEFSISPWENETVTWTLDGINYTHTFSLFIRSGDNYLNALNEIKTNILDTISNISSSEIFFLMGAPVGFTITFNDNLSHASSVSVSGPNSTASSGTESIAVSAIIPDGADLIYAGGGDDFIYTDFQISQDIYGGEGNDIFSLPNNTAAIDLADFNTNDTIIIRNAQLSNSKFRFSYSANRTTVDVDADLNGSTDFYFKVYGPWETLTTTVVGANTHLSLSNEPNITFGTTGNDDISAVNGKDTVSGLEGDDRISGIDFSDLLYGNDGTDTLIGGYGDDFLFGGVGDDQLSGSSGADNLSGGEGRNRLSGGEGADSLYSAGADTLNGGLGTDFFSIADSSNDVHFNDVSDGETVRVFGDLVAPSIIAKVIAATKMTVSLDQSGDGLANRTMHFNGVYAGVEVSQGSNFTDLYPKTPYAVSATQVTATKTLNATPTSLSFGATLSSPTGSEVTLLGPSGAMTPEDALNKIRNDIYGLNSNQSYRKSAFPKVEDFFKNLGASKSVNPQKVTVSGVPERPYDEILFEVDKNNNESPDITAIVLDEENFDNGKIKTKDVDFVSLVGCQSVTLEDVGGLQMSVLTDCSDTASLSSTNNEIFALAGKDTVFAGGGDDLIYGNKGEDSLLGAAGADTLYGGNGSDLIYGNINNDIIYGGKETDQVYGGIGNDVIYGNISSDTLFGNLGNDTLFGGKGSDVLSGGGGSDLLLDGFGDDIFDGGLGNDIIRLGPGNDRGYGGLGADIFWLSGGGEDAVFDFTPAEGDRIQASSIIRTSKSVLGNVILHNGKGRVSLENIGFDLWEKNSDLWLI